MKPVITHVIQHLKPGGIETLVMEMLRLNTNYDVHIIALEGTKSQAIQKFPILKSYRHKIHCLNKAEGVQWRTAKKLRAVIHHLRSVACVSHHIGPLLYTSMAKIGLHIVHLHVEHDAWHLNDPKRQRLQNWCLKLSQPTLVADAELVSSILKNKFPFVEPYVIHNGIDTSRYSIGSMVEARISLGLPHGKRLIGCAARLEPVKQIDLLISALPKLADDIELVIAGEGSQRLALMQHAKALGVLERVHFVGFQNALEYFYRAIDVFCLVSANEGFPLSVLEAQACGKPVVVNNVGGCKETVCPQTGLLLLNDDPVQLINAIKLQLIRRYEASPRLFIENNFGIDQMIDKYEYLIDNNLFLAEVA